MISPGLSPKGLTSYFKFSNIPKATPPSVRYSISPLAYLKIGALCPALAKVNILFFVSSTPYTAVT